MGHLIGKNLQNVGAKFSNTAFQITLLERGIEDENWKFWLLTWKDDNNRIGLERIRTTVVVDEHQSKR